MGGSVAGLLAAQVLSLHFDRVTVVERDDVASAEGARKGVPQGRHLHVLLAAGFDSLQRTLPDFRERALARGAIEVDVGNFGVLYLSGVLIAALESGKTSLMISRPAIESCIRERVLTRPNINVRSGCAVHSLLGDARAITGVSIGSATHAQHEELTADLVVDATGRGTRLPGWLETLGLGRPREEVVRSNVSYATCMIGRKPDHLAGANAWVMTPLPPLTRWGAAQAVEGDRYIVTFTTYLGDRGPESYAEMIEYARALPFPGLYELLRVAEPQTEVSKMFDPESKRRHYERMARFPSGLLVVGDALCSFNPAYGQGMTVAALEAEALDQALRAGTTGLSRRFFAAASKIVDAPWMLATGADFQWPAVEGRRGIATGLINTYIARVIKTAGRDAVVAERLLRVMHLLDAPQTLFAPAIVRRVLLTKPEMRLIPAEATLESA
jgi:hypothetical protein